jgi:tetratricopeptide (TPR) repeat protein
MATKFDGHPLMLRAICRALPSQPSSNDVKIVSDTLPSITSAKAFLDSLSNQLFYRVLQTSEQRSLLSRLAVLPGRFDWGVARSVAAVHPKLSITPSDWHYMKSIVLDELDVDHCSIPQLLKEIAKTNLSSDVSQSELLTSAAHAQLKPSGTVAVSFLDFHSAIFSLILAGKYRDAALFFTISVPRLMTFARFEDLSVLFLVFTGEPFQQKLQSEFLKWQLLSSELMFRSKDIHAAQSEKVYNLLARMRLLAQRQRKPWLFRIATANLITMIRFRRISATKNPPERAVRKVFAAFTFALRLTLDKGDRDTGLDQIDLPLKSYKAFAHVARLRDLDLLRDVALVLRKMNKRPLPDNVLSDVYATIAVNTRDVEKARQQFHEHSQAYEIANYPGGYFASQYGLAHILHERDGNYAAAREVLEPLRQTDKYPRVLKSRALVAIGDAWFAERKFDLSARCYTEAMTGHYVRGFRQHTQERLIDSLSRGGNPEEAFLTTVSILRRRNRALSPVSKGHLCARLVYTSVERRNFMQAAIACCSLRRLAEREASDQYHWLCLYLAAWTVKQIGVHDELMPSQDVGFRDISALSENVPDEFLKEWRESDKANVKALIHISAIFEIEKRYERALGQLKKAKRTLSALSSEAPLRFVLASKTARLHLLLERSPDAASDTREFIDYEISVKKVPIELAGFLSCTFLRAALPGTTDKTFQSFVESLLQECMIWPQARPGILFWYAKGLLDRLLVQKGRAVMRDAEEAAQNSGTYQILGMILQEKLFVRIPQFYPVFRETEWVTDVIASALTLGSSTVSGDARRAFAKTFRDLSSQNQRTMYIAGAVFARDQSVMDKYPFEVLCLALLKTGRSLNLREDLLCQLEDFLRENAPFLSEQ